MFSSCEWRSDDDVWAWLDFTAAAGSATLERFLSFKTYNQYVDTLTIQCSKHSNAIAHTKHIEYCNKKHAGCKCEITRFSRCIICLEMCNCIWKFNSRSELKRKANIISNYLINFSLQFKVQLTKTNSKYVTVLLGKVKCSNLSCEAI